MDEAHKALLRYVVTLDRALRSLSDPDLDEVADEVVRMATDGSDRVRQFWTGLAEPVMEEHRRRLTETADLEFSLEGDTGALVGDATNLSEEDAIRQAEEYARQEWEEGREEPDAG